MRINDWRPALALLLLLPGGAAEAQKEVAFGGATWALSGDGKVETFAGHEALRLRSGSARLVGAELENGTVELDVRTTGHRAFAGLGFRIEGEHREDFYLRPHNSGRFDALQYTPIYHGIGGWQLYPEHNAHLEIPVDRWLHVKLVVAGPRLEVFIDGAREPALAVASLVRGRTRGALELWASFPESETLDLFPVAFANVVVRRDDKTYPYPAEAGPEPDSGLVARWAVSNAFPEPADLEQPPRVETWTLATADAQGRVNLARWAEPPGGSAGTTVLSRVVLESDAARVARLGFGFSDRGTVYLNGRPVFRGDNTYRSRSQRYLGVMRVDNDVLYLPLEKGRNELVFAVSESFGGWGVTARLIDRQGVKVGVEMPEGAVSRP